MRVCRPLAPAVMTERCEQRSRAVNYAARLLGRLGGHTSVAVHRRFFISPWLDFGVLRTGQHDDCDSKVADYHGWRATDAHRLGMDQAEEGEHGTGEGKGSCLDEVSLDDEHGDCAQD